MTDALTKIDDRWMRCALEEGRRGVGWTSPNPPVGAVIVAGDEVLGRGWHRQAGGPHAEIEALRDAAEKGGDVRGATIYITLEPCSTQGRTGPCTEALVAAGIGRVVWGARDPNPDHAGRAEALMREAGLEVLTGVLEAECAELIRPFAKWVTTGMPYVIAKAAQSLDGRLTRPPGEGQWLTSEGVRAHGRALRRQVDAVLVGAETVRQDNPRLTIREEAGHDAAGVARGSHPGSDAHSGGTAPGHGARPQPWRVVLSRSGRLPAEAHLFTDEHKERTLVLPGPDLPAALKELAGRGVVSVLIEGGGDILGQAFEHGLVDELYWYVAPRLCGAAGVPVLGRAEWAASVALERLRYEFLEDSFCVNARPVWPALSTPA